MVIFLDGGKSYEQNKMVFKRQVYDCVGRIKVESSPRGTLREISNQPDPVLQMA